MPGQIDGSFIGGVKAIERRSLLRGGDDERSHATGCVSVTFGRGCVTGGNCCAERREASKARHHSFVGERPPPSTEWSRQQAPTPRESHECGGAGGSGREAISLTRDFRTGSSGVRCARAGRPSQDRRCAVVAAVWSLVSMTASIRRRPGSSHLWRLPRSVAATTSCVASLCSCTRLGVADQRSVGDTADDGCCCGWRFRSSYAGVWGASDGS